MCPVPIHVRATADGRYPGGGRTRRPGRHTEEFVRERSAAVRRTAVRVWVSDPSGLRPEVARRIGTPTEQLGVPGEFPFTRGVYPTMYTGRPWTMRQYAGFGTAKESNQRYHQLLAAGTTGLSVAFDLPTQMGYDSDHPVASGEVGKVGVAIDSIDDMRVLFDGIPLDHVTTSMTINAPAAILLAALPTGRRRARRGRRPSSAARFRTTCSRSTSPAARTSTRRRRPCV